MSNPSVRIASVLVAIGLSLTGCGSTDEAAGNTDSDETSVSSAPSTSTTETRATTTSPTTTGESGADEAPAESGDPVADIVIDGALRGGELTIDDRRFDVPIGSTVLITFESDEVEHLHLHGYDLLADLEPGQPVQLSFVADSAGSFEVELEDSGRFLFELLVR